MIAIGGAIGTGLFFASGGAIAQAGPGGAMLAYAVMGLAVFCMMQSLGEMATQLPIRGSFEAYAERFIDPSLAFAVGWNYWFSWAVTLAAELVAGALIVQFWFPHSNPSLCAMGFFALVMILNLLSVRAYAEAEYWFAGIKVVTVIIFLGVGFLMIAGMLDKRSRRIPELVLGGSQCAHSCTLCGRMDRRACGFPGRRVFVSGHGGRGHRRSRDRESAKERAQGHSLRFLANIVVLHRIDFCNRHVDRIHGSESAPRADETHIAFSPFTMVFQRCHGAITPPTSSMQSFSLPFSRAAIHRYMSRRECCTPCLMATKRLGFSVDFKRPWCSGGGTLGYGFGERIRIPLELHRWSEDLSAALQRLEFERISDLAGYCRMPSAVPESVGRARPPLGGS